MGGRMVNHCHKRFNGCNHKTSHTLFWYNHFYMVIPC